MSRASRGIDLLDQQFGGQGAGQIGNVVFEASQGVDDPEVRQTMESYLAQVAKVPGVQSLRSPYTPGNEGQISRDGRIAYAEFEAKSDASFEDTVRIGDDIHAAMPQLEGLRSSSVGQPSPSSRSRRRRRSASAFAIVILIVAFGSVLAMGLPVGVALVGIVIGTASSRCCQPHRDRCPTSRTFLGS